MSRSLLPLVPDRNRTLLLACAVAALFAPILQAQDSRRVEGVQAAIGEIDASAHASVEDRREPELSPGSREVAPVAPRQLTFRATFRPPAQLPAQPPATLFAPAKSTFRPAGKSSSNTPGATADSPSVPGELTFHPGPRAPDPQAPAYPVSRARIPGFAQSPGRNGGDALRTVDRQAGLRGSFSADYRRNDSKDSSLLKSTIQPSPLPPQAEGFSGPFHSGPFGQRDPFSSLSPFQTEIARPKSGTRKAKPAKSRAVQDHAKTDRAKTNEQPEDGHAPWHASVP